MLSYAQSVISSDPQYGCVVILKILKLQKIQDSWPKMASLHGHVILN